MPRQSAGSESPDLTARIDALFADIKTEESPGCALAVMRGGEIIHACGYGLADLEHQIPLSPESVFDTGSVSKQFTAACVVLLAQDGQLTLDDPVRSYIPELPDYGAPLTLRHLLHHTGGLRNYTSLMMLADLPFENSYPEDRITTLITGQRVLGFRPGDEFLYSNSGYHLLGEVVRRVSGRSLAQFAHERIFEPLSMQDTHFHDNWRRLVPRRAQGYRPGPEGGYELDISLFNVTGSGGLYSTVLDLARWSRIFTDPLPLGGQTFLDAMLTVGTLNDDTVLTYAAGLDVIGEQVSHSGGFVGYRSELRMVPQETLSIVCLSNVATFDPITRALEVLDVVQGSLSAWGEPTTGSDPQETAPLPVPQLEGLAGQYWSSETGWIWTVATSSEGLTVEEFGSVFPLRVLAADTFSFPAPVPPSNRLEFERGGGSIRYTSSTGTVCVLQRSTPPTLNKAQLQMYSGEYVSEELSTTWHFAVDNDQLVLKGHRVFGGTWEPLGPGVFGNGGAIAHFSEDHSGKSRELMVSSVGIRHIRFHRKT